MRVADDGRVRLPGGVRGRSFRLEVLDARLSAGAPAQSRARTAVGIAELRGPGVPRAAPNRPGRRSLHGRCGDAALTVDGRPLPLRPVGSVADLEAGIAVPGRGCRKLHLARGRHVLTSATGGLLVDLLRLRSPAPEPRTPAPAAGVVLSQPAAGRNGYEDLRVRMDAPGWIVFGESYNRGWRASCDGRSLGRPRVVDGFANGWRAPAGCTEVDIEFGPQRLVLAGYVLGGLCCLALVLLALWGGRRTRRGDSPGPDSPPRPLAEGAPPGRRPLRQAVAAGAVAAVALGLAFGLRAGPPIGAAVALVLWRGIGVRALLLAAGGLLVVAVPAVYFAFPPEDRGGYNTSYAGELLGAHWVVVAAVVLLGLALWRMLAAAGRARSA
jgi:hypothetical protein